MPQSDGFRTWTEAEIAQFEAAHPLGAKARLGFGLLLYTAQRRGDIIKMGRQHIKDGFIRVAQQKTGAVLEIPIVPELREILAAHPAEHLTFLTTRAGQPFSAAGFTRWFRDRCRESGLPRGLSAHGLRKALCCKLVKAGCTTHQVQAISGHASLKEVERYTRAADQRRLAIDAMQALSKPETGTSTGNPVEGLPKTGRNSLKVKDEK